MLNITSLGLKVQNFSALNILGAEAKKHHEFNLFTADTWDTTFESLHMNQG